MHKQLPEHGQLEGDSPLHSRPGLVKSNHEQSILHVSSSCQMRYRRQRHNLWTSHDLKGRDPFHTEIVRTYGILFTENTSRGGESRV